MNDLGVLLDVVECCLNHIENAPKAGQGCLLSFMRASANDG